MEGRNKRLLTYTEFLNTDTSWNEKENENSTNHFIMYIFGKVNHVPSSVGSQSRSLNQ